MARYAAFGFDLDSAIELPELNHGTASGPPDWRIEVDAQAPSMAGASLIGSEPVYDGVQVRAYANSKGFRLVFDDTGSFDVRPDERVIAWHPGPRATDAAVRADILGRVMAFAAHTDGHISLHASAVSIDGRGVAFLGPKHAGKSTLALALVRHGARLLTDDTIVVRVDAAGVAWAAPGVQRVRLWPDSARALDAAASDDTGAKPTVDRLTPGQLEQAVVPLSACYVLEAAPPESAELVHRERLSSVQAALACVRFCKLGALAGGTVGRTTLDRAATFAGAGRVFAAAITRDLRRLDDVAETFIGWQADAAPTRAVALR